MTLFDYMELHQGDIDTYDTEYDACVTVCYIDEENDAYDKFCNGIIKKVEINHCSCNNIVVNWCELIKRNMEKFKKFTADYWNNQYDDDEDEFIYQWISEIHLYMAGYVSDAMYGTLNKFLATLE